MSNNLNPKLKILSPDNSDKKLTSFQHNKLISINKFKSTINSNSNSKSKSNPKGNFTVTYNDTSSNNTNSNMGNANNSIMNIQNFNKKQINLIKLTISQKDKLKRIKVNLPFQKEEENKEKIGVVCENKQSRNKKEESKSYINTTIHGSIKDKPDVNDIIDLKDNPHHQWSNINTQVKEILLNKRQNTQKIDNNKYSFLKQLTPNHSKSLNHISKSRNNQFSNKFSASNSYSLLLNTINTNNINNNNNTCKNKSISNQSHQSNQSNQSHQQNSSHLINVLNKLNTINYKEKEKEKKNQIHIPHPHPLNHNYKIGVNLNNSHYQKSTCQNIGQSNNKVINKNSNIKINITSIKDSNSSKESIINSLYSSLQSQFEYKDKEIKSLFEEYEPDQIYEKGYLYMLNIINSIISSFKQTSENDFHHIISFLDKKINYYQTYINVIKDKKDKEKSLIDELNMKINTLNHEIELFKEKEKKLVGVLYHISKEFNLNINEIIDISDESECKASEKTRSYRNQSQLSLFEMSNIQFDDKFSFKKAEYNMKIPNLQLNKLEIIEKPDEFNDFHIKNQKKSKIFMTEAKDNRNNKKKKPIENEKINNILCFQDEFMNMKNEFSESWRKDIENMKNK